MTAAELISELKCMGSPLDLHVFLQYMADHLYEAEPKSGLRMLDAIDFKLWLQELAEAARK